MELKKVARRLIYKSDGPYRRATQLLAAAWTVAIDPPVTTPFASVRDYRHRQVE
jgi:hypothetical protein